MKLKCILKSQNLIQGDIFSFLPSIHKVIYASKKNSKDFDDKKSLN